MIAFVFSLLVVCALIAVVFGKDAAQGVFWGIILLVFLGAIALMLLLVYFMAPGLWHWIIGLIVVVFSLPFLGLVKDAVQNAHYRKQFAAKQLKEQQTTQNKQHAIKQFTTKLTTAMAQKDDDQCKEICQVLRQASAMNDALPMLELAINDNDPSTRLCAIHGLRYGYDKEHPYQGSGAAQSFSFTDFNKRASSLLCKVLSDTSEKDLNRAASAIAIGSAGYSEGLQTVMSHLSDPSHNVRAACCHALGKMGCQESGSCSRLIAALEDEHENVRAEAIGALGEAGDAQAVRFLQQVQLSSRATSATRRAAGDAVAKIKERVTGL